MNLTITPRKSDGVERLLQVSVPVEAVRATEEKTARRYASQARLPGFRAGKAPQAMVRRKFADAIRQETIEAIVREAYEQVLAQEKLQPIAQPHIHDLKFADGEPMSFELHVEVRPEIALARLNGFRVTRTLKPVTDDDVVAQVEQMRDQRASWAPVEDRPRPGDQVTVELATASDAGELGAGKEYRLELGSGQAIAGIEELVMEAAPGQTVERPVKWPDDFPDEAQRGRTKMCRATLKDVKRKSLPALDDAFAREMGDFDDLAALRATVRTDLARHAEMDADAGVRTQLLEQVLAANPFEVPNAWVAQLIQGYGEMYGVPEAEAPRFATEFRPIAERQVRRDLVIETIASRESFTATEKDVDDKVAELAASRNSDPGKLYASLQKAGRLKELERQITEDRVYTWLLGQNTVESST
ncbi:MAG: trigger factor [Gemmatimonadetes bacterium]|nr:trigger factor [Gemmatimonadota bacterium]